MTDPAAIAEDAQAYLPVRPSTRRLDAGDIVLRHTPHSPQFWYGSATRPRFHRSSVDRRIAEVRAWFRDLDRERFMWMVGESALTDEMCIFAAIYYPVADVTFPNIPCF